MANLFEGLEGSSDLRDIVSTFMAPTRYLDKYRSEFENNGFTIDSTHPSKDLRGGLKGTGPEQILVIWKAQSVSQKKVISDLQELTFILTYN